VKRFYSILLVVILIFTVMLTGCKSGKEEKKSKAEKPPSSLEELQKLTDEVLVSTMKKDWSGSLSKTKEVQSKWNELYPDLQKKGVSKDDVDNFVKDLNTLSDSLIVKTLAIPKTKTEETKSEESKSEESKSEEGKSEESKSEEGKSEESKSEESSKESTGSPKSGEESKKANAQVQVSMEEEGSQEKNQDPAKALEEVDPLLEINSEEMVIVNGSIELLKHIPKFTGLFAGKVPSDILMLKYLLYHVNVVSKEGNWNETNKTMVNIEEVWKSVEPKASETDESLKTQIAQSIKELKGVVDEKNQTLIGMKSNSTIEILEKLVKAFKEKE